MCAITLICIAAAANAHAGRARHHRLETEHGPVHVWWPARYDPKTAGIVVYVHGYFSDVDDAWRRHRLPRQFAESGLNALFIACDAPIGPSDDLRWTSIGALLETAASELDVELPAGRVSVVGHSGAHRTLSSWLDENLIDTIVLVDALYGEMPQFRQWLAADPDRRLINVAALTRRWTEALHAELADTVVFERFPRARAGKLPGARGARVVYVRSQHDHMELVTGGVALPMLLRALRVPVVSDAARDAPIRIR